MKDLKFSNVAIFMDGPEVNNASTRVFVGIVAGSLYGTVENVEVVSGTCSYNVCTNGNAYVGGIAGVAYKATIQNCTNHANIVGGRYAGVAGGIAGFSTGSKFNNCENDGKISAFCTGWGGMACAGGIAGEICSKSEYTTTFKDCHNKGIVVGDCYKWGIGYDAKSGDNYAQTNSNAYN